MSKRRSTSIGCKALAVGLWVGVLVGCAGPAFAGGYGPSDWDTVREHERQTQRYYDDRRRQLEQEAIQKQFRDAEWRRQQDRVWEDIERSREAERRAWREMVAPPSRYGTPYTDPY
jgi:hypothetical protein